MGVGYPAHIYLNEFGSLLRSAFDEIPYHVGSSLTKKRGWRDVDIRLIVNDEKYKKMDLGDPERPQENDKWIALTLAFSALGEKMTGLPIDFQIQQQTYANTAKINEGIRSAIGIMPLAMLRQENEKKRNACVSNPNSEVNQ